MTEILTLLLESEIFTKFHSSWISDSSDPLLDLNQWTSQCFRRIKFFVIEVSWDLSLTLMEPNFTYDCFLLKTTNQPTNKKKFQKNCKPKEANKQNQKNKHQTEII